MKAIIIIIIVLLVLFWLYLLCLRCRRGKMDQAYFRQWRYAHRGLHDREKGIPENSMAAFKRAAANGFGAELDVHLMKDGKLLPPFVSVSGLGETAAWDIMEGRKGKQFISIEEFSAACPKVSKTHIEDLKLAGAFGDLPETSQITLF